MGTNLYKDKVMVTPTSRGPNPHPTVPKVIFPNWREVLHQSEISAPVRSGYASAIAGYLDYCRRNGLSVTIDNARNFMADVERRQLARNPGLWKGTTQIYTHVMKRPGLGARSPFDTL